MRLRYKSILYFICSLIAICLALVISYYVYNEFFASKSEVVVDGNLTINYLNGNYFKEKRKKNLEFSVTNNSDTEETFYIKFANVTASNVKYVLEEEKGKLKLDGSLVSSIVASQISIEPSVTKTYKLELTPRKRKEYMGELVIALGSKQSLTFSEIILENNEENKKTPDFKNLATTNEGLIKDEDTFYFRGAITNNYVSFADNIWRIVKINGDGSVKLVLNGIIEPNSSYYSTDNIKYENNLIDNALNDWYKLYLSNYSNVIASHKFCNDTLQDENNVYAAYNRISKNFIPNGECLGTTVTTNIGLLTADEVAMAGATMAENRNYYLYNEKISSAYYTMTSAKKNNQGYYPFVVNVNGALNDEIVGTTTLGIRPVINIIKNITATGSGTSDNPYVLLDK